MKKHIVYFILSWILSGPSLALALVDPGKCPAHIQVEIKNIIRTNLTAEIQNRPDLSKYYESITPQSNKTAHFDLLTRSQDHLCVYSNGSESVLLQTNNGVDELVVPLNSYVYFRFKILTLQKSSLILCNEESSLTLWAPEFLLDSDGGQVLQKEYPMGAASSVQVIAR